MTLRKNAISLVLATAIMGTVFPAHADPSAKQGQNLQIWTGSDRFVLVVCLVCGLGVGLGGAASYADSQDQKEELKKLEMDYQIKYGKPRPCPSDGFCTEVKRRSDEAATQERGAIAAMVIGGLMIGMLPLVIYSGFQPKKPSSPNIMMKVAPTLAPGQGGLVLTGRF